MKEAEAFGKSLSKGEATSEPLQLQAGGPRQPARCRLAQPQGTA